MSLSVAREIVEAYGTLLEHRDESAGIYDDSALPCAKDDIKQALRVVLESPAYRVLRPMLRRSYVLLAQWQEGYDQATETTDVAAATRDGAHVAGVTWPVADSVDMGPDTRRERSIVYWRDKVSVETAALRRELELL